ncbi:MAG: hypothetical protein NC831_02435 [Candidatus Omnitrophica bacterium]|nr:hypothetical protein [Candidatus Omnitrophota bacterium]
MAAFEMYSEDFFERYPVAYYKYNPPYPPDPPEIVAYSIYDGIYPNYIKTPHTFWCPSTISRGVRPPDTINENNWNDSYSFVFGLTTGNNCPNPVPVISDNGIFVDPRLKYGNHKDGINVQYLDGSAMWVLKAKVVYYKGSNGPASGVNVACTQDGRNIDIKADGVESEWGQ